MIADRSITIAGGGLAGTLLAIYLSDLGFHVDVFEKRPDPLVNKPEAGRSINLALSHRGIKALKEAGIADQVLEHTIPMKGRMIHEVDGSTKLLPYGKEGQFIYSVSRAELNSLLIKRAKLSGNVNFHFNAGISQVFPDKKKFVITDNEGSREEGFEVLFGTDGANSAVRESLSHTGEVKYVKEILNYGYKELHIFPKEGKHRMNPNALHIWPRERFMLIALPNLDGSFTCTLFLPFKGESSFEQVNTGAAANSFFDRFFPDAKALIENLEKQFEDNPLSSLVTVHTEPWFAGDSVLLLGDAAHAIVPFYGQGMNAGFEGCRIFREMLLSAKDWGTLTKGFYEMRKPDADAIGELALDNFIEMRDKVADPDFLLQKQIEARIHQRYEELYLPLYSMVTFSDMPYSEARARGKRQLELIKGIFSIKGIREDFSSPDVQEKIDEKVRYFLNR